MNIFWFESALILHRMNLSVQLTNQYLTRVTHKLCYIQYYRYIFPTYIIAEPLYILHVIQVSLENLFLMKLDVCEFVKNCSDHSGSQSNIYIYKNKRNSLLGFQAREEVHVQVSVTAGPLTQMFPEVEVR